MQCVVRVWLGTVGAVYDEMNWNASRVGVTVDVEMIVHACYSTTKQPTNGLYE